MVEVSLPREKVHVVLTEGISESAVLAFKNAGYTSVTHLQHAPEEDELKALLEKTYILGIRSRTQLTEKVLEHAPRLFTVGCFCIGTNQVDLSACAKRGIPVFNAPFSNTRSVAELTLSSIIALMRGVPEKNAAAHAGVWKKTAKGAHEVRGKNLGIVGYGNIGSQLSVLASALGMHVYYYDITSKLPHGNAHSVATLDELYALADVVSYHVPETKTTKYTLNRESLKKMKDGVFIINYARGSVVDVDALVEGLESGKVAGAALDVFPEEPVSNNDEFISPLRAFDNVLLTPHIGGATLEAQNNIGDEVTSKLITYSDNGSTSHVVNFPEVALPPHPNAHRIVNIHHNVPGMLGKINTIFSERGVNIVGQFLQTKGDIGYVVVDIENGNEAEMYKDMLQSIDGSIRTRVIH